MNCLQCRAHWFFTALEKLLMNSTEVSGENLALKRRHPASTPPPPPLSQPIEPPALLHFLFSESGTSNRGEMLPEKSSNDKKRGLKKCKAQGTAFSRWMWKYILWLDGFYIWSISLVLSSKAWAQEKPEEFWSGTEKASMLCVTKQTPDENDTLTGYSYIL